MDAKRLEELAEWATAQEQSLEANEITDVAEYFRDLARCAAAWAKVERMVRSGAEVNMALTIGGEIQLRLSNGVFIWETTPIAAVEAAPEVKP